MTLPVGARREAVPEILSSINSLRRDQLIERLDLAKGIRRGYIRTLVIERDRIDILARILGYDVAPHHLAIAQHQMRHKGREYQILAPRGYGKTIIATIVKAIHLLLKRPEDVRILLASKTGENAKSMLDVVKKHLESNDAFRHYFGNLVGFDEWGSTAITIRQRIKPLKEASIETIGVDGTVVSRHYDVIIADDLHDEKNARTEKQRSNVHTWFYKVLLPCLEPPGGDFDHRGELAVVGTRYHFADLYGHLLAHEMSDSTYYLASLVDEHGKPNIETGRSTWEEKFPTEELYKRRDKMGRIIFGAQMQNNVDAMKGEIFKYDDMRTCRDDEVPRDVDCYVGVDLAIRRREESDNFSITVGAIDKSTDTIYVVDVFEGKLRFSEQTTKILDVAREWNAARVGIEINAYQEAQLQNVEDRQEQESDENEKIQIVGLHTGADKTARAWKLTPLFEQGKIVFTDRCAHLIEKFVLFPNNEFDDWLDSFDLMVRASRMRRRKPRKEVGLL